MITMATLIYTQDHLSPYMCSHIDQSRFLSSFLGFANLTVDTEHLAATISFPFPNWWWLSSVILQPSSPPLGLGLGELWKKNNLQAKEKCIGRNWSPSITEESWEEELWSWDFSFETSKLEQVTAFPHHIHWKRRFLLWISDSYTMYPLLLHCHFTHGNKFIIHFSSNSVISS